MTVAEDLLVAVEGCVPFFKLNSNIFLYPGLFCLSWTANVTFHIKKLLLFIAFTWLYMHPSQCDSETWDASAFRCRGLATGTTGSHLAISWPLSFQQVCGCGTLAVTQPGNEGLLLSQQLHRSWLCHTALLLMHPSWLVCAINWKKSNPQPLQQG